MIIRNVGTSIVYTEGYQILPGQSVNTLTGEYVNMAGNVLQDITIDDKSGNNGITNTVEFRGNESFFIPKETEENTKAKKFDNGKADLSLNPLIALEEMARAFMLGEKKYGRYNFYKGMESSRLVSAAMRHLHAWNDGEDNDGESGHSHLGHALACIAMLLQQQKLDTLIDNRYKG